MRNPFHTRLALHFNSPHSRTKQTLNKPFISVLDLTQPSLELHSKMNDTSSDAFQFLKA